LRNIAAVIITYNTGNEFSKNVLSLKKHVGEVIVVDNGSNDGSADFISKEFPEIQIVDLDENLGFAGGNNVGLRYAETEKIPYTLLLNNDTTIQDGSFLGRLVDVMEDEQDVGAVGPAVEQTDGQTQLSILPYPSLYNSKTRR